MRPISAATVVRTISSPWFIALPERIAAKNSSCSVWYMLLPGPSYCQGSSPSMTKRPAQPSIQAMPFSPTTRSRFSPWQPFCCRVCRKPWVPSAQS